MKNTLSVQILQDLAMGFSNIIFAIFLAHNTLFLYISTRVNGQDTLFLSLDSPHLFYYQFLIAITACTALFSAVSFFYGSISAKNLRAMEFGKFTGPAAFEYSFLSVNRSADSREGGNS